MKIIIKTTLSFFLCSLFLLPLYGQQDLQPATRKLLLRDEGMSQLSYVDIAHPELNWYTQVPPGRDLQLIGNGRLLIGTTTGFEEREIATGSKVYEVTSFAGTIAARRLRNGNTVLVGLNWQNKEGIVLVIVNEKGQVQQTIVYPGFTYVRLARETATGTFLITSNDTVFEGDSNGNVVWKAKVAGPEKTNAWQALRLANGQTVVSSGYGGNIQIFGADGKTIASITGPTEANPHFYAGYQILSNGNFLITNWQGHGPNLGNSGTQLLEYTPDGKLAWSWKQDAAKYSSLQGVIVLNGLDLSKLHVENGKGVLAPVQ